MACHKVSVNGTTKRQKNLFVTEYNLNWDELHFRCCLMYPHTDTLLSNSFEICLRPVELDVGIIGLHQPNKEKGFGCQRMITPAQHMEGHHDQKCREWHENRLHNRFKAGGGRYSTKLLCQPFHVLSSALDLRSLNYLVLKYPKREIEHRFRL